MKITLTNIGKRYNREWIFRNISYKFSDNNKYVILGTNGCGKSTLLQIIAGILSPSEGEKITDTITNQEFFFKQLSYASPYLELAEEMTWKEAIAFHGKFKNFTKSLTIESIISISGLESSSEKELRYFSSGMKQRAKLTLAILSDSPILMLDEPGTNLDEHAIKWYHDLIAEYGKGKLIIICSNYNKEEYPFCNNQLVLKPL